MEVGKGEVSDAAAMVHHPFKSLPASPDLPPQTLRHPLNRFIPRYQHLHPLPIFSLLERRLLVLSRIRNTGYNANTHQQITKTGQQGSDQYSQ